MERQEFDCAPRSILIIRVWLVKINKNKSKRTTINWTAESAVHIFQFINWAAEHIYLFVFLKTFTQEIIIILTNEEKINALISCSNETDIITISMIGRIY